MPRTETQWERIRDESRSRIVEGALRLFARRGYAATSVRMIAEETGVSQGLLYNYYEGKAGLLRAIFERGMADVNASFEQSAGAATLEARIEGLVRAAFEIVRENLDFWRLTYQLRMQPDVVEGLGEKVVEWSEAIRLQLEALTRGAESAVPEADARLLFAAIDGAAQHYALDPEGYPLDEVAGALIRRFVQPGGA